MAWMAGVLVLSSSEIASDTNVRVVATGFGASEVTLGSGCPLCYRVVVELGDVSNQQLALVGFNLEFDGGALDLVSHPGGRGRIRLNRVARLRTMAARVLTKEECRPIRHR